MTPARSDLLTVGLSNAAAGVWLAIGFVHAEIAVWWQERPVMLGALAALAVVLSFVGATVPNQFRIQWQLPVSSTFWQAVAAAVLGALIALLAGAIGWMAADSSLWVVLLWFFLGSVLLATYFRFVPRRKHSDG